LSIGSKQIPRKSGKEKALRALICSPYERQRKNKTVDHRGSIRMKVAFLSLVFLMVPVAMMSNL